MTDLQIFQESFVSAFESFSKRRHTLYPHPFRFFSFIMILTTLSTTHRLKKLFKLETPNTEQNLNSKEYNGPCTSLDLDTSFLPLYSEMALPFQQPDHTTEQVTIVFYYLKHHRHCYKYFACV